MSTKKDPVVVAIAILTELSELENRVPGTLENALKASHLALKAGWVLDDDVSPSRDSWRLITSRLDEGFDAEWERLKTLAILARMVADRVFARYEARYANPEPVLAAA